MWSESRHPEVRLGDAELAATLDEVRREIEHLIRSGEAHTIDGARSARYRTLVEYEARLLFERDRRARR